MTGEMHAGSAIYFQDFSNKQELETLLTVMPSNILEGARPRLIDEWQDAPAVWDKVRIMCDHSDGPGQFILTGSTSKKVNVSHTSTGRISEVRMYPMSLYESGESNGKVSLMSLFDGCPLTEGCASDLTIERLVFATCRGGWPSSLSISDDVKLAIAKDYYNQILTRDMFSVDDVRRKSDVMDALLRSYSKNVSTLAKKSSIYRNLSDMATENTLNDYMDILKRLYVVEEMNGWCPSLRSSSAERSGPKREFVNPSIAVAALGASSKKLMTDLITFGFIFENLCVRDLRIYSSAMNGRLSYYHDRYDLEADAVLHLDDGRYALIEFKLGSNQVKEGSEHLLEIERLIEEKNRKGSRMDMPSFKMVLTAGKYGYKTPEGVYVIPIGCLKP